MRDLQTHARFGLLMSALALMSVPSAALAQEAACATDADCEHGYTCEAVGGGCAGVDIACTPGGECPPPPECETVLGCVPARDCEADGDCATGWKCATEQYSECTNAGGAAECLPGEECVKPEIAPAPDCETKEVSFCAPPWALPCEEAADCGAGFECVEHIAMSCNGGSAGAPTPTPGDDPAPDSGSGDMGFAPPAEGDPVPPDQGIPGECTSEPTGEFYCRLIETTCSTDADCAAGLTCQEQYGDGVACGGATPDLPEDGSGSGGGSGGGADPDQDRALPADCVPPAPTYACAPPGFNGGYGYDYGHDGRGEATGGVVTPDQGGSSSDPNGQNGGEEPPASPAGDDAELSDGDDNAADMTSESSGCSTTGGSPSSGGMMLMGLAVLGLALRRRVLGA
jgi:MYXO-CTERM domain-containing protein